MRLKTSRQTKNHQRWSGFFRGLSSEAKELLDELKEEKNDTASKRLVCVKADGTIFNFNIFKSSLDFPSDIYNGKILLEVAKNSQYKMFKVLDDLNEYNPTRLDKMKTRDKTLNDAEKLYKNKSNVIKAFESGVFPFNHGFQKEKPGMSDKALPNWVKVSKKRFNTIKKMQFKVLKDIIYKLDHSVVVLLVLMNQAN